MRSPNPLHVETGVDVSAPLKTLYHTHEAIVDRLRGLSGLAELAAQADEARRVAASAVELFQADVLAHHQEEERDLFPAVTASARPDDELVTVKARIERLTLEHRALEKMWKTLEPSVRAVSKGRPAVIDTELLARFVHDYMAHAHFEEQVFLPMAQGILERNPNHLSAVGLALHLHRVPDPPGYI